ncbi:hypothetical protein [Cryobacterium sp. PAMC25264]|uniref:hypothetical protein n=1 Tax=Cryobacterium sp. PAMC25264 TaxID=2861288 RepID=UPI001C62CFF4|nr:hypothetical protein [Cryobacterium sp. PAMC25264]QYF73464.1 hypothetical protein KY500_17425 [Cryobacterium sp. PAMC25264]
MDYYKITVLVVCGVMLIVFGWLALRTTKVSARALRETARRAGLAITPEVEPVLVARIRARTRSILIGTVIALIVAAAVLLTLPVTADGAASAPLLLVVLTGLGAALGAAVAESRSALVSLGNRPRLARTPTPTRADYLSTVDRWCGPALLGFSGVALVGMAVVILANPDAAFAGADLGALWWPGAAIWLIALTSAVTGRILTMRVLQTGQPARDDIELAWSDALRSLTLRAFAQAPAVGAVCSVITVLQTMSAASADAQGAGRIISLAASVALLVFALALVWLALWLAFANPIPHYLTRLWPAVAAQLRASAQAVTASPDQARP